MTFALAFPDRAQADQAAAELRERGFDIVADEPLTAEREVRDADELADLRDELDELAARLGGAFLGSGGLFRL